MLQIRPPAGGVDYESSDKDFPYFGGSVRADSVPARYLSMRVTMVNSSHKSQEILLD